MFEKVCRTLAGLILAAVGLLIVLADVAVSYKSGAAVHLPNIIVGGVLVFAGGFIISPGDVRDMCQLGAQYIPFMRHDGPPGGPTGGVP